jgi:hypothetical protein
LKIKNKFLTVGNDAQPDNDKTKLRATLHKNLYTPFTSPVLASRRFNQHHPFSRFLHPLNIPRLSATTGEL